MNVSLDEVNRFWDVHPCDYTLSAKASGSREYLEEVAARRYTNEWHIPLVAQFERYVGQRVLEIGCGLGADAARFAAAGAQYTGVDLTATAVHFTRAHLAGRNLPGIVLQCDAEHLVFPDDSFDHVYSFGVIHHSPHPPKIVREIRRVLVPGGTFCVMIYHKNSWNYWVEIMCLRRILRCLLMPRWAPRVLAAVTAFDRAKLERQQQMFLSPAARDPERWLSMNTDGPDCPLARIYTRRSVQELFVEFEDVRCRTYFFDKSHYPFVGRLIPRFVQTALGRAFGWHLIVTGRKPRSDVSAA